MVSDIKGPGPGVITALEQPGTPAEPAQRPETKPAAAAQAAGVVELTPNAERLQALTRAVADVPEVDAARVDKYRQALADGTYQIDADAIADKFARLETSLGGGE